MSLMKTILTRTCGRLRREPRGWRPREVRCWDGATWLQASFVPSAAGLVRVVLEGSLTPATASMIERWFVTLRDDTLAVEVAGHGLVEADPGIIPVLLRISRRILRSGATIRFTGFGATLRHRLRIVAPGLVVEEPQGDGADRPAAGLAQARRFA